MRAPAAALVLLLCSCAAPGTGDDVLLAGAAAVEITPAVEAFEDRDGDGRKDDDEAFTDLDGDGRWDPVWLAGFNAGRTALGVRDPLWARALVLEKGGVSVALVALDLVGLLNARIEAAVAPLSEGPDRIVDHVIVSSTHQHSGPDTLGLWGPFFGASGLDAAYLAKVEAAIRGAVRAAKAAARPARLHAAGTDVPGVCKDSRAPDVRNERAAGLLARGLDGSPIGVYSVFACHPEAIGRKNRLVSSDYAHELRRSLERRFPGAVAVFAAADVGGMQTPAVAEETWGETDRVGRTIGEALGAALAAAPELEVPALRWTTRRVEFPLENRRFAAAFKAGLFGRDLAGALREQDGRQFYASRVSAVRLGDAVIATTPGECLPEVGHAIRSRVRARHRLLVGLAQDEVGYILPKGDFDPKKYEESMSLGPETAPLLQETLESILEGF